MPAFLDPKEAEFWVGAGLLIFLAIVVLMGAPKKVAHALDAKSAKIRSDLEEAARLRTEAEALLTQLRAERAEAERRAAEMLAEAEAQAKRMEQDAREKLEEQIARRAELADRRIAQAESQAAADVKAAAVDLAARAAEAVLAGRLAQTQSDPLVARAVEQIPAKLS
jgi:F-type H+-transporting ATPase subunit b